MLEYANIFALKKLIQVLLDYRTEGGFP